MAELKVVGKGRSGGHNGFAERFIFTPYQSVPRLLNLAGVLWQNFLMPDRSWARPIKLILEPSNLCNLECPLCPTGRGVSDRQVNILDFDVFREAVDPLAKWLYEAYFYNWGEPMLNRDLFRMVAYLSERRVRTVVSTNLTLADSEQISRMIESRLDTLVISLDGTTQDVYSRYRRKGDFEDVRDSIREVISIRDSNKSAFPRVVWQFVVFSFNQHQIDEAIEMAKTLGVDQIRFVPCFPEMEQMTTASPQIKLKQLDGYQSTVVQYQLYHDSRPKGPRSHWPCNYLWAQFVLRSDGGVAPCCASYYIKDDFGSVKGFLPLAIWNNDAYQRARRAVRTRGKHPGGLICDQCLKNELLA
jgi:MoaA/NifB/PqqE/SkfB family radical SAM enzyme